MSPSRGLFGGSYRTRRCRRMCCKVTQWSVAVLVVSFVGKTLQFTITQQQKQATTTADLEAAAETAHRPKQRIVHFDLKGAPPKVDYFIELLHLIKNAGGTGVLIEWEDTFPYSGHLAETKSGLAYSMDEVKQILGAARKLELEFSQVIPLIQTLGHMEWLLKLESFARLRDDPKLSNVICAASEEGIATLRQLIKQVITVHDQFGIKYFHIGCDEVFKVGVCKEAEAKMKEFGTNGNVTKYQYMMWHMERLARYVQSIALNTRVLAWNDMLMGWLGIGARNIHSELYQLIEPVVWNYAPALDPTELKEVWKVLQPFKHVWAAGCFKGADGANRYHARPMHYLQNTQSWLMEFANHSKSLKSKLSGMILTGWSRFDHFSVLCETLPVGVPSMIMSLLTLTYGKKIVDFTKLTQSLIACPLVQGELSDSAAKCNFTGFPIWQAANRLYKVDVWSTFTTSIGTKESNLQFNVHAGWMGNTNRLLTFSSPYYMEKMLSSLQSNMTELKKIYNKLNQELRVVFTDDVANEFLYEFVYPPMKRVANFLRFTKSVLSKKSFERRPLADMTDGDALLSRANEILVDNSLDETKVFS